MSKIKIAAVLAGLVLAGSVAFAEDGPFIKLRQADGSEKLFEINEIQICRVEAPSNKLARGSRYIGHKAVCRSGDVALYRRAALREVHSGETYTALFPDQP